MPSSVKGQRAVRHDRLNQAVLTAAELSVCEVQLVLGVHIVDLLLHLRLAGHAFEHLLHECLKRGY